MDVTSVAVLSELDGILTIKRNIKKATEGFISEDNIVSIFLPSGFGKSSIRHSGREWPAAIWLFI